MKKLQNLNFWRKLVNGILITALLFAWVGMPYLAIQEMDSNMHIEKGHQAGEE
jgi:hypothetical protein